MKRILVFLLLTLVTLCNAPNLRAEEIFNDAVLEELPDSPTAKRQDEIYLPILMYHQISKDESRLGSYVISPWEFESDLKLLQENGFTTITVADLLDYAYKNKKLPKKPIMLTFDDGFESDYVYAFPLLKKYNEKAIFSIIGRFTDMYSDESVRKHINYSHVTWDEIREMHESGLADFHNHSYDMHDTDRRRGALKKRSESVEGYEKTLSEDLGKLNEEYSQNIGRVPTAFTCPFGCYNETLAEALKKQGFQVIFTSYQKINKLTGNPEELYYLKRFVRAHNRDIYKLIGSWNEAIESVPCGTDDQGI